MSQKENKPFQWDDRKVKHLLAEYWNVPVADLSRFIDRQIERFKESHSPISSSEKVDWEVIKLEHKGAISFLSTGRGYTLEEIQKDGWSIYSVRRLSDKTEWTIGEDTPKGKILKFDFFHAEGNMYVHYDLGGWDYLNEAKKAPIPEDRWFLRMKDGLDDEPNGFIGYYKGDLENRSKSDVYKWFVSKEAAAKYWEAIGYPPPLIPVYLTQPQIDKLIAMLGGEGI